MLIEDRSSTRRIPDHLWQLEDRRDLIEIACDVGKAMEEAVFEFNQIPLADLEEYAQHYCGYLREQAQKLQEKIEECQRRMAYGRPSRWHNSEER